VSQAVPKSLRQALNIPADKIVTAYVGKATFNRGIEDILQALPKIRKDVVLVVLGYFEPDFRAQFEELKNKLGVSDRVYTFGPVPGREVASWLADVAFPRCAGFARATSTRCRTSCSRAFRRAFRSWGRTRRKSSASSTPIRWEWCTTMPIRTIWRKRPTVC
jgi:hypothetical protein